MFIELSNSVTVPFRRADTSVLDWIYCVGTQTLDCQSLNVFTNWNDFYNCKQLKCWATPCALLLKTLFQTIDGNTPNRVVSIVTVETLYWPGLNLIPPWRGNYIHYKLVEEIAYPNPNFLACTVEVWEWTTFIMAAITYSCWGNLFQTALP